MERVTESQAFAYGIIVGIGIHQQRVVSAHKRKEPLKIGDNTLYYIQDGRERLEEFLEKICK